MMYMKKLTNYIQNSMKIVSVYLARCMDFGLFMRYIKKSANYIRKIQEKPDVKPQKNYIPHKRIKKSDKTHL